LQANKREQIEVARAGEIVGVVGLRFTSTGDTLCAPDHPILLGSIAFPEPVISVAVEPVSTADKDRLALALKHRAKDDPTFSTRYDEETGQTLISGMGDLHLEIIGDRIVREWNVKTKVGKPRVAYKQTITLTAAGEGRFIQKLQNKSQYGHVILQLSPEKRAQQDERLPVAFTASEEHIPRQFRQAIESGIRTSATAGGEWGYPLIDLAVTITGGSTSLDATEEAYEAAASLAFREASEKAQMVLLEPIMDVEVEVPSSFVNNILKDLQRRDAEITDQSPGKGDLRIVKAYVPLARMFGYSTDVRSMSQGRATFTMEPHAYSVVPEDRRPKLF
jgi:elongation factor G